MDWLILVFIIISAVGILRLQRMLGDKKHIPANITVILNIEYTNEDDNDKKSTAVFVKTCPFKITPVPGMYFEAPSFEGLAEIKRVKLDDEGYAEINCFLETMGNKHDFFEYCDIMKKNGWHGGV